MKKLSVIVPMFNEAARLESGVGTILRYLADRHPGTEVLLVDDGSRDETGRLAETLLRKTPALEGRVIRLPRNQGKGAAVKEGMSLASGEIRLFADADNATPIEELERLLPLAASPRTIVIGSRGLGASILETRQPPWREWMGKTFNLILRAAMALPYKDTQCGFKLFGAEAARVCFGRQKLRGYAFDVEILRIAREERFDVIETPVRWRHVSQSRVRLVRDSLRMLRDVLKIRFGLI